ncbi:hypothetical protein RI367_004247 [Sorochytrium milnesiophthora]
MAGSSGNSSGATREPIDVRWAQSQRSFYRNLSQIQLQKEQLEQRVQSLQRHATALQAQQQQRASVSAENTAPINYDTHVLLKRIEQVYALLRKQEEVDSQPTPTPPWQPTQREEQTGSSKVEHIPEVPLEAERPTEDPSTVEIREAVRCARQREKDAIRESLRSAYQQQHVSATAVTFQPEELADLQGDDVREIHIPNVLEILDKARQRQGKQRTFQNATRDAFPDAAHRQRKPANAAPPTPARFDVPSYTAAALRTRPEPRPSQNSPVKNLMRRVSLKLSPQKPAPQLTIRTQQPHAQYSRDATARPSAKSKRAVGLTIDTHVTAAPRVPPQAPPTLKKAVATIRSPQTLDPARSRLRTASTAASYQVDHAPPSPKRQHSPPTIVVAPPQPTLPKSPTGNSFDDIEENASSDKPPTSALRKSSTRNSFDDDQDDDNTAGQSHGPDLSLSVTRLKPSGTRNSFDSDEDADADADDERPTMDTRQSNQDRQASHPVHMQSKDSLEFRAVKPRVHHHQPKQVVEIRTHRSSDGDARRRALESGSSDEENVGGGQHEIEAAGDEGEEEEQEPTPKAEVAPSQRRRSSRSSAQSGTVADRLQPGDLVPDPTPESASPEQRLLIVRKLLSVCEKTLGDCRAVQDLVDAQCDADRRTTIATAVLRGSSTSSYLPGELGVTLLSVLRVIAADLVPPDVYRSLVLHQRRFSLLEDEYRRAMSVTQGDRWNSIVDFIVSAIHRSALPARDICYCFAQAFEQTPEEDDDSSEGFSPSLIVDILGRARSRGVNFSTTTQLLKLLTSPDMLLPTAILLMDADEEVTRALMVVCLQNDMLIDYLEMAIHVDVQVSNGAFGPSSLTGALLIMYLQTYAMDWLTSILQSAIDTVLDDRRLADILGSFASGQASRIPDRQLKVLATFIDKKILEPLLGRLYELPGHVRYVMKDIVRATFLRRSTWCVLPITRVLVHNFVCLALSDAVSCGIMSGLSEDLHESQITAASERFGALAQILQVWGIHLYKRRRSLLGLRQMTGQDTSETRSDWPAYQKCLGGHDKILAKLVETVNNLESGYTRSPEVTVRLKSLAPKVDTAMQTIQRFVIDNVEEIVQQLEVMDQHTSTAPTRLTYEHKSLMVTFFEKIVCERCAKGKVSRAERNSALSLLNTAPAAAMRRLSAVATSATSPIKQRLASFSKSPDKQFQPSDSRSVRKTKGRSGSWSLPSSPVKAFQSFKRS